MRTATLFLLLAFCSLAGSAQNIAVTFTGTVSSVRIDSVTATNLATDESILLPGDATLFLTPKTGVSTILSDQEVSLVFPNPFPGQATLLARVTETQDVNLVVKDLSGRIVTRLRAFLQPGENSFSLTLSTPGIYLAILKTSGGMAAHKLICTSASGAGNQLTHNGSAPNPSGFKTQLTAYSLGYSAGETIQYRCCCSDFRAVFTDSPMEPIQYEVAFPPIAVFTIDPGEGSTETRFVVDASGCTDAETPTNELEVRWDFDGDSIWDTEFDPTKSMVCQFPSVGPYSIRLEVKDQEGMFDSITAPVNITYPSFTDSRDGNVYHYKKYRNQYWMLQNLAFLPAVSPSGEGSQTEKYYYVYDYEGTSVSEAKATANYTTYGVLYNWPASLDACPTGWHLPGDEEWMVLEMYLGMDQTDVNTMTNFNPLHRDRNSGSVGSKLKEAGTTHWNSPNTGATNSSDFTALAAGVRLHSGGFGFLGLANNIWSSTVWETSNEDGIFRGLGNESEGVIRYPSYFRYGYSVRCVKD